MENILHTLFFIFTFAYNFITVVPQAYSANNPAFEDFSRISGDTLKTSHGSIIYSAVVRNINLFYIKIRKRYESEILL